MSVCVERERKRRGNDALDNRKHTLSTTTTTEIACLSACIPPTCLKPYSWYILWAALLRRALAVNRELPWSVDYLYQGYDRLVALSAQLFHAVLSSRSRCLHQHCSGRIQHKPQASSQQLPAASLTRSYVYVAPHVHQQRARAWIKCGASLAPRMAATDRSTTLRASVSKRAAVVIDLT